MSKGLVIPYTVADGITLTSLMDQHFYLKEETRAHLEDGKWLHPDDLAKNQKLIPALEMLIEYYGGEV